MSANILQFPVMSRFPNRIRELREEKKISQQRLGDAIGVSKMTISDLERGNIRLSVPYMQKIARELDISPTDLLSPDDNPFSLSDDERILIERYRAASEEERNTIQRVSEAIAPFRAQTDEAA